MKLFLKLFAALLALVILAVVVLVTIIDPNDYKEEIQAQVKQTINRDLFINGDIGWSFYPQIGFNFAGIELNNLQGFNRQHLAKVENASVGLAVLPLFKGEVQLGKLTLNGLRLNLITKQDGSSNLDNMFPQKSATTPKQREEKQSETEQTKTFDPSKLQLAGINIENVQIEVQDLQINSITKIDIQHIHLGSFEVDKETELSIATDLLVAQMDGHIDLQAKLLVASDLSTLLLNQVNMQSRFTGKDLANGKLSSSISTNIVYNLTNNKAALNDFILQLDKIKLQGNLSLQAGDKTKIRFNLQGDKWDLTPYLAQTSAPSATETQEKMPATAEQEPDLSFLHQLDVQGTLAIAGIKADEIKIGEINTSIEVNRGKAQIKPLTAQLYEGLLTLNASLADNNGKNSYQVATQLEGVKIYPLLVDAAQIDILSGTTAFNFSANGKGVTASKIKSGLVGKGDFKLTDGELYGINIPQEIRILKAKLTGKPTPTEADIKKTDFASLTGNFTIKEGLVDNNKLLMLSPVMRLDGAGLSNILQESLDYKLSVTPLSRSDAETDLQDLHGVTIPLLIKGSFTDPKFSLDTEGALKKELEEKAKAKLEKEKQKLQEKSQQELEEKSKELEEKLKKKLGKLFG
jgi:AsmA protein